MNDAHLHLAVNHLPIVGVIIGTLVLIAGFLLRKDQIKGTALGIFIFSGIAAIVANATGEGAEEIVEEMGTISHKIIHVHEEMAETFLLLTIGLSVISLITLFLAIKKKDYAKYGYILVFVLALACIFFGKETGTTGGEIRHTEIRATADE